MIKYIFYLYLFVLLSSCVKETIKDDAEYKRFLGVWDNNPGEMTEKAEVEFEKGGKMIIKKSLERTEIFTPTKVYTRQSDYSTSNGVFWDYYEFSRNNKTYTFLINL